MAKFTVGWFTFTCSEDSTILMTELLNTRWSEWQNYFEFKYAKALRKSAPLGPMDVAFVEGAISSEKQAEKLRQIRRLAKTLVAVGSCACTGQPSSQRNQFTPEQLKTIQPILDQFQYSTKVQKISDLVKLDYQVPGCPMDETKFLELIKQLIKNAQNQS